MFPRSSLLLVVAALSITPLGIQACRSAKELGEVVDSAALPPIADVLGRHVADLMAIEGVVGTYEGRTEDGQPCIKVMVIQDTETLRSKLPRDLEGYPVVVHETGEIAPVDK